MAKPVYDLTITNGTLATHETSEAVNIGITDGCFAALGGTAEHGGIFASACLGAPRSTLEDELRRDGE